MFLYLSMQLNEREINDWFHVTTVSFEFVSQWSSVPIRESLSSSREVF